MNLTLAAEGARTMTYEHANAKVSAGGQQSPNSRTILTTKSDFEGTFTTNSFYLMDGEVDGPNRERETYKFAGKNLSWYILSEVGNNASGVWTKKTNSPEVVSFVSEDPVLEGSTLPAAPAAGEADLQEAIDSSFVVADPADAWDCSGDKFDVELDLRSSVVAACAEKAELPKLVTDTYCD